MQLNKFAVFLKKPVSKYLLAGVSAVIIEYGSFYLMYLSFNVPLYIANSISFVLGLAVSFLLNRIWTFGNKNYSKRATHQFGFYIILAGVNLLFTNILIGLFTNGGINPKFGKIMAMAMTSVWNFFIYKALIFKQTGSSTGSEDQ